MATMQIFDEDMKPSGFIGVCLGATGLATVHAADAGAGRMHLRRLALWFAVLVALLGCASCTTFRGAPLVGAVGKDAPRNQWAGAAPKYIFMFIGDGMGKEHIALAEAALENGAAGGRPLSFTRFESRGAISTHSASSSKTDSAAAATALATGYKTNNGMLGLSPGGQKLTSVAALAKAAGKRVGILSTVSLNHATPAAYYAHVDSRSRNYDIGLALQASRFDYFAGGGLNEHAQQGKPDLYALAEQRGFTLVRDKQAILAAKPQAAPVLAINPELTPNADMPYRADMTDKSLTLADFVRKGCELLDNENGFFMVVEGGKIDQAAHKNRAGRMVEELADFSEAVEAALAFAAAHPGQVLFVVTADHETGGLTRVKPGEGKRTPIRLPGVSAGSLGRGSAAWAWTTGRHTPAMVDVYATGLGAWLFRGHYDNTDIAWKLINIGHF